MTSWPDAVKTAAISGTTAGLLSAGAMATMSKLRGDNAVAPLNGPSQWLWGERGARESRFNPRTTLPGVVIHQLTSIMWASAHERVLGRHYAKQSIPTQIAGGLATAAIAYFVDYALTPKRFQPGFEKHLSGRGMVVTYAAFGLGLALTGVALKLKNRRGDF